MFNLIVLIISVSLAKCASGYGLVDSTKNIGMEKAAFLVAIFIFVNFLTFIILLTQNQLGDLFPFVFNLAWTLDLILAVWGAINGIIGPFTKIIEQMVGKGSLAQTISILFVVTSILVVPQMIPYGNMIPKIAATVGIAIALRDRIG